MESGRRGEQLTRKHRLPRAEIRPAKGEDSLMCVCMFGDMIWYPLSCFCTHCHQIVMSPTKNYWLWVSVKCQMSNWELICDCYLSRVSTLLSVLLIRPGRPLKFLFSQFPVKVSNFTRTGKDFWPVFLTQRTCPTCDRLRDFTKNRSRSLTKVDLSNSLPTEMFIHSVVVKWL